MLKAHEEPMDPISQLSLAVFRLNGLLIQNGDRITHRLGQSSARWQVLGRAGVMPQTVAHMARDMGQSRQAVQRIANVLSGEGLIAYRPHPTDNRTRLLELTQKGRIALDGIYKEYSVWLQTVMPSIDTGGVVELTNNLQAVEQILRKYSK